MFKVTLNHCMRNLEGLWLQGSNCVNILQWSNCVYKGLNRCGILRDNNEEDSKKIYDLYEEMASNHINGQQKGYPQKEHMGYIV